jgi:hypothetical protein
MRFSVKRTGRTWAVVDQSGNVVEGGFFSRDAAEKARDGWAEASAPSEWQSVQAERRQMGITY